MKISYSWLRDYVNTELPPQKIAEILTDTGLEVEGFEEVETVPGGLRGVKIGEVLSCEPHPNADRLKLTTVNVGEEKSLQIVCGAPNVAAGQKVPVATVGATLYPEGKPLKIKKSKLRGETSEGMICAEDELGLGTGHDGIMVLDDKAEAGQPASDYFQIESDTVFEIGLTPNRTDAMSHYGVARDLRAALLRYGHEGTEVNLPSVTAFSPATHDLPISIKVEDTKACPRYAGVSLKNITVAPSPDWLQNRLNAIGVGPVNNIVDITNYVLHETGHPLHAFDADEIAGSKIVVKHLPEGTRFTTLDEKERSLSSRDLMICDEKEGMVIAGVFGGHKSGVSESTQNVFIESAIFDPVAIRKTAKRHTLSTDASFRYERGVDPELTLYALKRAALLMREIAGGEIAMKIKDEYPKKIEGYEVALNLDSMNCLIGSEIEPEMVRNILQWLDIRVVAESGKDWNLKVPPYRRDVQREADVVEEVLRIYGFNSVETSGKMSISIAHSEARDEAAYREKISAALSGRGFAEIMSNSLTKTAYFEKNGFDPEKSVPILNPLSQDLGVMRQSLLFGGLEAVVHNSHRQRPDLKLYEFGRAYGQSSSGYQEQGKLALWVSGLQEPENWKNGTVPSDFYTLKNEVIAVLEGLGISDWQEEPLDNAIFEESLSLKADKKELGYLGKIAPELQKELDIRQPVYFAQLHWEKLVEMAQQQNIVMQELPRYPEVRRDLALLLDREVRYADLQKAAFKAEKKTLRAVNLFDVYEGKNLPEGKKSYALSFILRDDEKTLNDKQVDKTMERIRKRLQQDFDAELR